MNIKSTFIKATYTLGLSGLLSLSGLSQQNNFKNNDCDTLSFEQFERLINAIYQDRHMRITNDFDAKACLDHYHNSRYHLTTKLADTATAEITLDSLNLSRLATAAIAATDAYKTEDTTAYKEFHTGSITVKRKPIPTFIPPVVYLAELKLATNRITQKAPNTNVGIIHDKVHGTVSPVFY